MRAHKSSRTLITSVFSYNIVIILQSLLQEIGEVYAKMRFPIEFTRKSRNFDEFVKFKATEMRMITLYGLEMMIAKHAGGDLLYCFRMLCTALRIMSEKQYYLKYHAVAESFCHAFVVNTRQIFGNRFVVMMVHLFQHVARETRRFGPLETFSAFRFENTLKTLKERTRSTKNPLHNITEKLKMRATFVSKAARCYTRKLKVSRKLGNGRFGVLSSPDIYLANKFQDSHFSTSDAIWEFKSVSEGSTGVVVQAYRYMKMRSAYTIETLREKTKSGKPQLENQRFDVGLMGIFELRDLSDKWEAVPLESIRRKYVVNEFDGKFIGYPLIQLC
jgi:hypothetical protein